MSGWSCHGIPVSRWGGGPGTLLALRTTQFPRGSPGAVHPRSNADGAGFERFPRPAPRDAARAHEGRWGRLEGGRDLPALEAHWQFSFLASLLRTKKDERRCMLLPT